MNSSHEHLKTVGDVAASSGSALLALSHWSEIITPIVALIVGLMTLIWWTIRLFDRWRLGARQAGDE